MNVDKLWSYVRGKPSQPATTTTIKPSKEFNSKSHDAGAKRQRAALGNITNQANNQLLAVPSTKQKSAKKSKIQPTSKPETKQTKQSSKNSLTSRRKRKSSVSDSVVPHFADMDLSATPSATPNMGETKRSQSEDLITVEAMKMETSMLEISDRMEEEILDEEEEEELSELDEDEDDEKERERERDAKRNDKVQRQKLQHGNGLDPANPTTNINLMPTTSTMVIMSPEKDDDDVLPPGAHNIDTLDENDPQWVTSYVNQIYDNLRENELKHLAKVRPYLDSVQTAVTSSMRGILVDWLVEVAEEYELSSETLYLSVNFLDRFLSTHAVDRRKFQLVGVACMLIASKYEEIYAPAIDEFVYISANTYKRDEILLMEILILNTLNFDLTAATAKVFLRRFLKAAGADLTLAFLSSYLAELTLQEYGFIMYRPSLIAASAVFLALRTLGREPWTPTLQHYTKYSIDDPTFQKCIHQLYQVHLAAPTNSLKAIHEKYSDTRFRKVATIPPPVVDPQTGN